MKIKVGVYFWVLGITSILALSIRATFLETFRIPSEIMKPTIFPADVLLVSKIRYGVHWLGLTPAWPKGHPPQHGDIVVYTAPEMPGRTFLKRIVALPHEQIEITTEGKIVLNNKPLLFKADPALSTDRACGTETQTNEGADKNPIEYTVCYGTPPLPALTPQTVPEGHYFVMGDNRTAGLSQQDYGIVAFDDLVGTPLMIIFSTDPNHRFSRAGLGLR